jgi:protein-S-isoprenylcysteine O-methyltransferase Ste14
VPDRILATWFRHRSALLLLLAWPVVAWLLERRPVRLVEVAAGALLLAGGVALRLLAIRRIGRNARVARAHASTGLVRGGPYAWSRNPLYLAAGAMLCGLALMAGAGAAGLLLIPTTVALYTPVVIHEERTLRQLLGPAYAAYAESIPRWLGVRRAAPAAPGPVVPWPEVMHREQALVPGSLAAAAGILSVRLGLIPMAEVLDPLARALGTSPAGVVGLGLAVAGILDAWKIDRKRRRRAHPSGAPSPTVSGA